jgi:hypothetical protein
VVPGRELELDLAERLHVGVDATPSGLEDLAVHRPDAAIVSGHRTL